MENGAWKIRPTLLIAALAIGAAFTVASRLIFAEALNRVPDFGEADVFILNTVLAGAPLSLLAFRRAFNILPWLVAIILTAALEWWWLSKGIAYQRAPDGSGVDLFGAFIMLFSPIPISAAALGIDVLIEWVRADPLNNSRDRR